MKIWFSFWSCQSRGYKKHDIVVHINNILLKNVSSQMFNLHIYIDHRYTKSAFLKEC